jgi:hypothetical protein
LLVAPEGNLIAQSFDLLKETEIDQMMRACVNSSFRLTSGERTPNNPYRGCLEEFAPEGNVLLR